MPHSSSEFSSADSTTAAGMAPGAAEPHYLARADVVASDIGGHWALLDLETSLYYTLNATGAEVWNAMQSPAPLSRLISAVTTTFSVSEDLCRPDVEALLQDLVSAGLVTRTSQAASQGNAQG